MPSRRLSPVQSFTCVKIGWMRIETGANSAASLAERGTGAGEEPQPARTQARTITLTRRTPQMYLYNPPRTRRPALARSWWRRPLGQYDGRLMRCAPGTHEAAAALVTRHIARDARVLDLASGTGAFLARLRDLGYANLDALELNVEGFRLEGVTPRAVDLNSTFA